MNQKLNEEYRANEANAVGIVRSTETIPTIISRITGEAAEDEKAIAKAAELIAAGALVAFPTETVYGLGGDAFDTTAAERIYAAKGRPSDNPLIVHIAEVSDMIQLAEEVPPMAYRLAEAFWPGPMTLIVRKNDRVPKTVTGGLDTVAIRLPSHPVARELIRKSGTFIAAPSANLSGRPSPTNAEHVIEDLAGRVDMILDAGSIEIGLESTIVDVTGEVPMILRPGYITREMIAKVTGEVLLDPALMTGVKGDVRPKAPGMKYRHYAPKAELTIVEPEDFASPTGGAAVVAKLTELAASDLAAGRKVGLMVASEHEEDLRTGLAGYDAQLEIKVLGSAGEETTIAHNLFGALRDFDTLSVDVIYSEGYATEGIGQAIMNRMLKAAGQRVIRV